MYKPTDSWWRDDYCNRCPTRLVLMSGGDLTTKVRHQCLSTVPKQALTSETVDAFIQDAAKIRKDTHKKRKKRKKRKKALVNV